MPPAHSFCFTAPHRRYDAAATLLSFGAAVNVRGGTNWTPLHIAARDGHLTLVQLLVEQDADINAMGGPAEATATALHLASTRGHTAVVMMLLELKADVNSVNCAGETPLMKASYSCVRVGGGRAAALAVRFAPFHRVMLTGGHRVIVKKLVKAGANRKAKGKTGWAAEKMAWQLAQDEGHTRIVQLIGPKTQKTIVCGVTIPPGCVKAVKGKCAIM